MDTKNPATYGRLVEVCRAFGICRTLAFALAAAQLIETFMLRGRRYVYIESVRTLPDRIGVK